MGGWIIWGVFLGTSVVVMLVFAILNRESLRITSRVRRLSGPIGGQRIIDRIRDTLGRLPFGAALLGMSEEKQALLRQKFMQGGIYNPQAAAVFMGARVLLTVGGSAVALGVGVVHLMPLAEMLSTTLLLAGAGMLLPGMWLDSRIGRWQRMIRRGLPDAMDMLVLCLEGGTSFTSAFQYVLGELRLAHPELGGEMEIVQHEMMLGKTPGEAMQKFGQRCDLEDLRTLAGVLLQNERFGVSVAKALRIHADTMRQQRQQRAEEMAQKAAVKILFPTLLCIFPAIFIVILGPAAFKIMAVLAQMK